MDNEYTENEEDSVESEDCTSVENTTSDDNNNSTEGSPVYSQMSLDFVARQVDEAYRKGKKRGYITSIIVVAALFFIFIGTNIFIKISNGSLYAFFLSNKASGSILDRESTKKLDNIYRIINNTYIDKVDKQVLCDGMYKGLLEALDDPYSVYYNEEEFSQMMESSSGTFEGIGAYLSQNPDTMEIRIVRPIKNSPAEAAGLLADDIIVEVDKEDITGQDLNVVVSKVRGEKGTTVNIGIRREGEDELIYFDVERDKINEESVSSEMLDDNIGYIYISEFAEDTANQYKEAYDELIQQGMTSIIVDLRSNGGGYVDTAVSVADRMVKEGKIVSIKGRATGEYAYEDKGDEYYCDIPCVLLVDGNTASASEILTACLKDYGIATVIGTQTFGKGIVQDVLTLGDGTGLKITSSKYYTPNGENIHGVGITPDIIVEWDHQRYVDEKGFDNQLEAAKSYLLTGKVPDSLQKPADDTADDAEDK